jgi:beta-galactosidase/beta-glucuronidase
VPVDPDLVRRDLIMARAAGFNRVRFISGVALPEQLDFADELGLLVYAENMAAWCLQDLRRRPLRPQHLPDHGAPRLPAGRRPAGRPAGRFRRHVSPNWLHAIREKESNYASCRLLRSRTDPG